MSEEQKSYRQIMKATSLFGGVQVFTILIAIIRAKFIAILLGPAGMGIAGLLNSTTGLINSFTNFGLGTSAVKNVAAASGSGNERRIAVIITIVKRWVWVTGLLGMIITIATAPLLSRLTFGNSDYTFSFIAISVSLLFAQLTSGQLIILQGMRKLQYLAKANLTGSILGLLLTMPLYYWLGIKGIVPAIIITSLITFGGALYFSGKIKLPTAKVSKVRTVAEGKEMLTLGFMISISGMISLGVSYIVQVFISRTGGVAQVGLYNSGFSIINIYVAMVFTAMATDYYPRLAANAHDNQASRQTINQQAEIALLILAPIIMVFLVFIRWVIIILYTDKFLEIDGMIHWAILGIFFKAASWSIAFIFLAKGASKLFFWSELIANINLLILNILGYKFGGLSGLGISFIAGYFFYLIQVFFIARRKYHFGFNNEFYYIFCIQFFLGIACFTIVKITTGYLTYFVGSIVIAISTTYSIFHINKKLDLMSMYQSQLKRFKKL